MIIIHNGKYSITAKCLCFSFGVGKLIPDSPPVWEIYEKWNYNWGYTNLTKKISIASDTTVGTFSNNLEWIL